MPSPRPSELRLAAPVALRPIEGRYSMYSEGVTGENYLLGRSCVCCDVRAPC